MTISTTNTKDQHNGNDSATSFNYNFKILDQSHLEVTLTSTAGVDSILTITTDYTVSGVGDDSGSISYPVAGDPLATGEKLTIRRKQDFLQSTDLQNQGGFFAEVHEEAFDKQAMFALQNEEELDRTLRAPVSDPTSVDMTLPTKDARKGTVLGFNATSGDPEAGPEIADVATLAAITTDIATLADIEDGTDATDAIQTVAGISSNVSTVAGISANVTTVAGISSDVTAVAADATDIGAVAAKATEIGRLGTADAVADMAILGTADVVTDLNTLGTADVVADLNTLGTADVVSDMNTLGTADVVSDMNTLATTAIVNDMDALADISSDISTVSGISSNVTTVAGISSDVTAVAGDATDIGAVAAKATEIGRLGTADAVADMVLLGTTACVADMAILGTADVVADLNTLGTSAIVTDLDTLADISGNITTVAGISGNVTTVAGISSDVTSVAGKATEIGRLGTADAVADMALLGTADCVADMNTLATSDIVADLNTLATSDIVSDLETVADNIAGVNSFADRYRVASSAPASSLDEGDLYFNTTDNKLYHYNGSSWVEITAYSHPTGAGNEHLPSDVSQTEAGYLNNVSSNIQTQLDARVTKTGSTGSAALPSGTTVQRDGSPSAGYLRWNTTDTSAEVYDGSGWAAVGGGNSTDKGLYEHAHTISADYSITSGNNALTAGPITIDTGYSVTIPTGSTWVIA